MSQLPAAVTQALHVGGDSMGIRAVYSNGVSGQYLEALKSTASKKLSFQQIEEKATASIHVVDLDNNHKVLSFSRSRCVQLIKPK